MPKDCQRIVIKDLQNTSVQTGTPARKIKLTDVNRLKPGSDPSPSARHITYKRKHVPLRKPSGDVSNATYDNAASNEHQSTSIEPPHGGKKVDFFGQIRLQTTILNES